MHLGSDCLHYIHNGALTHITRTCCQLMTTMFASTQLDTSASCLYGTLWCYWQQHKDKQDLLHQWRLDWACCSDLVIFNPGHPNRMPACKMRILARTHRQLVLAHTPLSILVAASLQHSFSFVRHVTFVLYDKSISITDLDKSITNL